MGWEWPTLKNILEARDRLAGILLRTPLHFYPQLSELLGAEVFVKHENYLPTGAFKVRGGINLISQLDDTQKKAGVITASTGNHAQSIALAGRIFDVPVTIVLPHGSNPSKVRAVESLGAEIVYHGEIFDQAKDHAEALSRGQGARFIHPANEPHLISGVATYAVEILEEVPDLDIILVPVGGGSGASGCCLVMDAVRPQGQVIAVQAAAAPAAYRSWEQRSIQSAGMETAAEGLATNLGYALTQEILQRHLEDFVLVSEEEMQGAVRIYLELVRNLAEEAGAAPLAAALKIKKRLEGKSVALVLSGGNLSLGRLRQILSI
ncbi:MAG: pyridoxal-phosphate dependent enzyme [Candidatus Aminicenantaceae bacterium]